MQLTGKSFLAGKRSLTITNPFQAIAPATNTALASHFYSATLDELNQAVEAAEAAFPTYAKTSGVTRAKLLRAIAAGLEAASAELVERAHLETALPMARLQGEVGRTANQLRLFAEVVEEGSWVNARIDTSLPERKPLPRPDLRSMLFPLGPVAVFGASNFPLAFSVAGGDTASALASGNPVIVKAHAAHPGTSELVGGIVTEAVVTCGLPAGVFSLLFDAGLEIGTAVVQHPAVQAVAFTGSHKAGRSLMNLAAARPKPIPCFTEMSSTNPVFVLPGVLAEKPEALATALHGSFTLGAGQFCTKPGMVFVPEGPGASEFGMKLRELARSSAAFTMLTPGIAGAYRSELTRRATLPAVTATQAAATDACAAAAILFETSSEDLAADPTLAEEHFGPSLLVVSCATPTAALESARRLEGHLTATILGTEEDLAAHAELLAILEQKVGRLIFNGYPTGVEVSHAMVHGGPYPSTSDRRFTSVGTQAIFRFVGPRCYQNFPGGMLPAELQDSNPLGILRVTDGVVGRA